MEGTAPKHWSKYTTKSRHLEKTVLLAPGFNFRVNPIKKIIGVRERKIIHRLIKNKKKIRIRREIER